MIRHYWFEALLIFMLAVEVVVALVVVAMLATNVL